VARFVLFDRRKGQQLPEQEQGEEVPGKGDTEGGTCVDKRRHVLAVVLDVEGVHEADHGHDRKDIREDEAEPVHAAEHQLIAKNGKVAEGALGAEEAADEGRSWKGDQIDPLRPAPRGP